MKKYSVCENCKVRGLVVIWSDMSLRDAQETVRYFENIGKTNMVFLRQVRKLFGRKTILVNPA